MSREILFRAKRVGRIDGFSYRSKYQNGDWVFGLIAKQYPLEWQDKLNDEMIDIYGVSGIEIDRKTIGQFIGLCDKNGNKIFEGDIVRQQTFYKFNSYLYKNELEREKHKNYLIEEHNCIFDDEENYHVNYDYIVEFKNCRFYPFADDNEKWGYYDPDKPVEIIGNIYDNPV